MKRFGARLLAWAASLVFWGCVTASQQLIDPPVVEYLGMDMPSPSLLSALPTFRFRITNPNPMGFMISAFSYDLRINHRKFVKGVAGQEKVVRPAETVTADLVLPFYYMDLLDVMPDSSPDDPNAATVRFDLSGSVTVGPFSEPYAVSGEFTVPRLPRIELVRLSQEPAEDGGEGFNLELNLTNMNPLPLTFSRMTCRVNLGGIGWVRAAEIPASSIPPQGEMKVRLVARVDDASLVVVLSGRSSVEYVIEGDVGFETPRGGTGRFSLRRTGTVAVDG